MKPNRLPRGRTTKAVKHSLPRQSQVVSETMWSSQLIRLHCTHVILIYCQFGCEPSVQISCMHRICNRRNIIYIFYRAAVFFHVPEKKIVEHMRDLGDVFVNFDLHVMWWWRGCDLAVWMISVVNVSLLDAIGRDLWAKSNVYWSGKLGNFIDVEHRHLLVCSPRIRVFEWPVDRINYLYGVRMWIAWF